MTGRYVCVDSSVAFKWFCSEREASVDEALSLLSEHVDGSVTLVAPAHMPAEVLNALHHRPSVTAEELATAAEGLAGTEIVYPEWDAELLSTAARLAAVHGIAIHDALFPALAELLGCELVTADRAQASACPKGARVLGA